MEQAKLEFNSILIPFERLFKKFRGLNTIGSHLSFQSSIVRTFAVIFMFSVFSIDIYGQVYEMDADNGKVISTCSGTFYDSGGPSGSYANDEDYTVTFSAPVGNTYRFDFTGFSVRAGDALYVYDGPDASSPLIGTYFAPASPWALPDFSVYSSGSFLTFNFKSDNSFNRPGWAATIHCLSCPPIAPPVIVPSNTEACAGSTVDYSVDDHPGSTYNWTVYYGTPASVTAGTSSLSVTWNLPGMETGWVRVQEISACGATSYTDLYVDIYPLPAPSITGAASVCPNTPGVLYSTPAVAGDNYNWSVSGGTVSGSGNNITVNWGAISPGTVEVTETNLATGCSVTTPVYTVLIQDLIPPVITGCPADINLNVIPGTCNNTATWTEPTAIDDCEGALPYASRSHAPGAVFNAGTTTVSYTFTDAAGNSSVCSFDIIVTDNENPVAICQNISVTLDAGGNATITGADVNNGSTDNCGIATLSVAPNTFNSSNIGANNVILTVTDDSGNTSTCNAVVTVLDNTPPVAICKDITVYLDASGSVTITGADVDNGSNDPDGIASLVVSPASFSCINIGPNVVTLTVTDNAGKSSTCNSTVTVADNLIPVVTCPGNLNINTDPGVCSAFVNYVTPAGTDNCSGSVTTQIAGLPSGSLFPVGATTNTFLVTDASGNTATCTFTITVTDNIPPVINLPIPPVITAGAGCQAPIPVIAATFSDNCTPAGSIVVSQVPAAGTLVGTGITAVTITATDLSGNTSVSIINVTVVDGNKPVITAPANISLNLDNNCQATVPDFIGSLLVTDDCTPPGSIIKTQTPAAGTVITGVASTNILIEATDASGNKSSVTVLFITADGIPPVAVCRNTTLYVDGSGNATLTTSAVNNGSFDNCTTPVNLSLSRTLFSCTDIGAPVPVTLTARDASLNTATCISQVTVLDTVKPVVNVKTFNLILGPSGTGTLLPSDVDNGSFDNCGTITLSVAPNTFNCASTGTRTVILTALDAHGNSRSKSVNITVSSSLSIDAMALSSCDLVGPFARYSSTVTGGNGVYSYFWDGLEDFVNPFVTIDFIPPFIHYTNTSTAVSPIFNNTMPDGTYHIRLVVTDGNGCRDTSELVLVKDAGLVFNNITELNSTACENEVKTYSVAAGATSYAWSISNGVFLSATNTNTVTVQWGTVSPGTLVATIIKPDLFGNSCASSVRETVTLNPAPLPAFNAPVLSVCSGSEYTYTLTSSYVSHNWTVTNGIITGGGAAGNNFVTVRWGAFALGTVSVNVTNASGCKNSVSANVTINALPVPTLVSSDADNTFCVGTNIIFTAGGGNNYAFRVNGGVVQNSPVNTYSTSLLSNNDVVDVIVTNANNCIAQSAPITNTVITYPAPTITSSDADNRFCAGSTIVFTATGGISFDFRVDGGIVQTGGSPTYTTSALTNGQTVDVIVTNAGGCSAASPVITNVVDPMPVATLISSEPTNSFCTGTTVTFTAGGGNLYNFRIDGIGIQNGASAIFTTNSLKDGEVVDVIVTNAGGCIATSSGIINTVLPLPVPTLSSSDADNIICIGTSVTFTAGGGTSYNFRVNGNSAQTGALNTYTTNTLTSGQIVDVIVTNAGGCFSTSSGITTVVTTPPTAAISYPGTPYCSTTGPGQAVTLTGTSGGTYTALPAGLSINAGTGAINPSASTPGNYTVTYTLAAAGGCGPVTATANITITAVPVASFNYSATPYCSNGADPLPTFTGGGIAGTFSATPGGLVFISTATGQVDLSASIPGTYSVTNLIPAGGGCGIITATSLITITAMPTASISYAGTPYCSSLAVSQPVTLTGTGVYTGGTFSSTPGLSINPATGAILPSASTPGLYTVTYTLAGSGGCAGLIATTSVTINQAPAATISYAGSPYCNNVLASQAVTLTGTIGGTFSSAPAGLTIDPSTGSIMPGTSSVGAYIVTYTIPAGAGCPSVQFTTPVTITAAPTASISYLGTPFCTSISGTRLVTLTGTGTYTGGTFSSTPGLTINGLTGAITPSSSSAGTYTVTYITTGAGGCTPVTATTSVTITALPTASISYTGAPFCSTVATAQPVTITGVTGGTFSALPAGLSINPATGAITPSTSTPATYSVTYTIAAAGGCGPVTATTNVTITELPTVTITYPGNPFCISLGIPQPVTINGTADYLGGTFTSTPGLTIDPASGLITPSTSAPGSYTVTYTTVPSGGCAVVLAVTTVDIASLPIPSFTAQPGANTCIGQDVTYTTQPGQTSYVWSVPGSAGSDYMITSGGIGSASNTVTLQWLTSGSKTVTVNYSNLNGCSGSADATNTTIVDPVSTIILTSAPATSTQLLCINTPITTITYSTTGASGATFAGLPAGVTGNWAANVVTISGTPSVSGLFNYTVTLTGGCGVLTANGTITVTPDNTISITSLPGTDNQSICIGSPITTITYATTGATGANFIGFPAGMLVSWVANTVTISGTPTAAGVFNYTVNLTGGCGTVSANGIINVAPNNTITLTSLPATTTQTVCLNTPVTNITWTTTGATGATFAGLPAGVTGNWAANVVTISGSPTVTGPFNFTVTLTGGCGVVTANGTITVTPDNTITLTSPPATANQTVCVNTPVTNITWSTTGATGATFAGLPAGVTGNWAANVVTISGSPTAAGPFNYTVTLTGGCGVVTANGTITVTPDNTITLTSPLATTNQTLCNNTPVTSITYSTTGATGASFAGLPAGVTGNWAANVVTISGSPTVSGTFNYTVTLTGGCGVLTANGTIDVTPDNTITLTSPPATANQTVCVNTPITDITYSTIGATGASFAGLPAGVTGGWAGNVVTISGSPTVSGTFNYTVTLTGGCGVTTSTGTITVTPDNTITLNSAPGTDNQTVCNNTPITDITYSTAGATGATFAGLPAGVTGNWAGSVVTISGIPTVSGIFNYTVTLTGGCGTVTAIGTITSSPDYTVALTSAAGTDNQEICLGSALTTITYTTTGATGAIFAGLPAGMSFTFAANTITISGTPTDIGVFNYVVTLTGGCGSAAAIGTITVQPDNSISLTSAAGTDNQNVCLNLPITPITYLTSGATGVTFAGLPSGVTGNWAGNVVTITGSPTATGSFNYIITLTGGCGVATASGTLDVASDNTISLTSAIGTDNQTTCINTALVDITYSTTRATGATITGLPSGVTGNWAVNTVTISGTPDVSGIFNYTVTLTGGCGNVSITGAVTVDPLNNIVISSPAGTDNQTLCINTPVTSITYTTTGATGATFTGLPAGVNGVWAAGTATIIGIPSESGIFNYTVTLTGGCGFVTAGGTINVTPDNTIALTSALGTDSQTGCLNTSIIDITYATTGASGVTVTGLPAGVTGVWASDVLTISGTPTVSGTFNYTIDLTGGCGTVSATGFIMIDIDNTISLTSAGGTDNQSVCINSPVTDITYGSTGATGATVTGLPAGLNGVWAADMVTISGVPTVSGSFSYTVTLTGGCGVVTATGSVTVNPLPILVIIDPAAVCSPSTADITAASVTAGSTTGLTFTYWTDALATVSYPTPESATTGTYYIMGTDASGCFDVKPVNVVVNDSPTASVAVTNVSCFGESTGSIDLIPAGGAAPYTFLWSNAATTEDISGLPAGDYTVTITDLNGCTADAMGSVKEPAEALAGITVVTNVSCSGSGNDGSIDLTVTGGTGPYTFLWSNGEITEDISNLVTGDYTVVITDASGCTSASGGSVVPAGSTFIASSVVTDVACQGGNNGSIDLTVTGGTAPYSYLWSNGEITEDIVNLAPGNYTVTITDAGGCVTNSAGIVSEPAAALSGSVIVTNVSCFGNSTGSVDLTVTGGTAPYTFLWNTGAVTEDLTNVAAASYTVTITDARGCTAITFADVTQPVAALSGTTVVTNILCNGSTSGAIDLSPAGGTAPYTFLWNNSATTEDISGLAPGSYNVKITDANGCSITVSADITQPAKLLIEETHTDAKCPDEMNGSITITATGGVSPYNVLWSDGVTTFTRSAKDTTYTAVVIDANGCAETIDVTVGFSQGSSCVVVPAVITPNGDSKNDTWIIKNIELYPNAEVLVYSRWGKTVFKTKNISANPWDGKFNGKLLPTDSYHYILYLNDPEESKPRTGTVTIIR